MQKNTLKALAMLVAVSAAPVTVNADIFSYNNGVVDRSNVSRYGSTQSQGMAMRLGAEKLSLFKGCNISTVGIAFGSKRTNDGTVDLFIATSLDEDPIYTQNVTISKAAAWLDFALDTPYTITGEEEELYIGYTAEIGTTSLLLVTDMEQDYPESSYYLGDNGWVDMCGSALGAAMIRVDIDDAPQFTDLLIKPVDVEGYFLKGGTYSFEAQVFNFGTETINSFEVEISIEGSEPETRFYDNLSIEQFGTFDISVDDYEPQVEGSHEVSFVVTKVNDGDDAEMSDNEYASSIFFYPENMDRTYLIEVFTGQTCSQCPSGHRYLSAFIEDNSDYDFAEIAHHIGYYVDSFTMASDYDFLGFYDGVGSSTYAPGFMMNRTYAHVSGFDYPIIEMTSRSYLDKAFSYVVKNTQPYVSLSMETAFDEYASLVDIKVGIYVHKELPSEDNIFNIMLVQDGIIASQTSGGDSYVHNAVYRGPITGNSWGYILEDDACKAGSYFEWSTSYELPDSILSDYYSLYGSSYLSYCTNVATVAKDMKLVFLVGSYDSDYNSCQVYNSIETSFGESKAHKSMIYESGITDVGIDTVKDINIYVDSNRMIRTSDENATIEIYSLSGGRMSNQHSLSPGIYIVRAQSGTTSVGKKIIVK